MLVTRLKLRNWRNFRDVDISLRDTTYVLGANATGKSNLLDAFRFLRDISKPQGGDLQRAISDRGGISKLRCLHARRTPEVVIDVELAESLNDPLPAWRYRLAFRTEPTGTRSTPVAEEKVWRGGSRRPLLSRPDGNDQRDPARLTQTHLHQIGANAEFRQIAEFFGDATYLHVVPQLLKFSDQFSGHPLENDPFGQGLLEGMAKVPEKTRDTRLKRIEHALKLGIPRFEQLRFSRDKNNGHPHMEALYAHHRPHAGWQ